jgi:arsenate reductase
VPVAERPVVLFVCVHNAGRSQMAAALLEERAGDAVEVRSAGSAPAAEVHPSVVAAMAEVGIDLSARRPKVLTDAMAREADVVVTMGCGDACPIFPGTRHLDWELEDPSGKDLGRVREIRDEIDERVQQLVAELTGGA